MADMDRLSLNGIRQKGRTKGLSIENQPWGYVIRSGNRPPLGMLIGQLAGYFFGVSFVTAGLGLLLLPGLFPTDEFGPMRIGAATLFGAGATYLLWFSSRGIKVDVEINTAEQAIREVIQNRVGPATVIGHYAFSDIGGVYLETAAGAAPAQLVLGCRGQMILVAEGSTDQLTLLREQLSKDLMGPMGLNLARRPEATRNRANRLQGRAA